VFRGVRPDDLADLGQAVPPRVFLLVSTSAGQRGTEIVKLSL